MLLPSIDEHPSSLPVPSHHSLSCVGVSGLKETAERRKTQSRCNSGVNVTFVLKARQYLAGIARTNSSGC